MEQGGIIIQEEEQSLVNRNQAARGWELLFPCPKCLKQCLARLGAQLVIVMWIEGWIPSWEGARLHDKAMCAGLMLPQTQ